MPLAKIELQNGSSMLNKDKLAKLLERAALSVTVAGPEDVSELRKLLKILDQISCSIGALEQAPASFLDKARGMSRSAAELINAILKHCVCPIDSLCKALFPFESKTSNS